MLWRDYFYFSKGERRGLILLLVIIVIAGTLLFLNNQPKPVVPSEKKNEPAAIKTVAENPTPNIERQEETVKNAIPAVSTRQPATSRRTVESVPERVSRLTSRPQPTYTRAEKFEEGTVVELNTADTTTLKKVPGIGSAFASRIVNYRRILGGFHSVTQLSEVYGIDEERFIALQPWFSADPSQIIKIEVNKIAQDSLQRHPYISYAQARVIMQLRRQKGKLTGWENLQLLKEFTEDDRNRLLPYVSFE